MTKNIYPSNTRDVNKIPSFRRRLRKLEKGILDNGLVVEGEPTLTTLYQNDFSTGFNGMVNDPGNDVDWDIDTTKGNGNSFSMRSVLGTTINQESKISYGFTATGDVNKLSFSYQQTMEGFPWDSLRVLVDDVEVFHGDNTTEWVDVELSIFGAGPHTITFRNYTDGGTNNPPDTVWVDNVKVEDVSIEAEFNVNVKFNEAAIYNKTAVFNQDVIVNGITYLKELNVTPEEKAYINGGLVVGTYPLGNSLRGLKLDFNNIDLDTDDKYISILGADGYVTNPNGDTTYHSARLGLDLGTYNPESPYNWSNTNDLDPFPFFNLKKFGNTSVFLSSQPRQLGASHINSRLQVGFNYLTPKQQDMATLAVKGGFYAEEANDTFDPFYTEDFADGTIPANWTNDAVLPWTVENAGLGGASGYYFKSPQVPTNDTTTKVIFNYDFGVNYKKVKIKFNLYQDTELCCDFLRIKVGNLTFNVGSDFVSAGWNVVEAEIIAKGSTDIEFFYSTDGGSIGGNSEVAFTDLEFSDVESVSLMPTTIINDIVLPNGLVTPNVNLNTFNLIDPDTLSTFIGEAYGITSIAITRDPGGNATGSYNSLFGDRAGQNLTTGGENTSVGGRSLNKNTVGIRNSALGYQALYANIDGDNNTSIGWASLSFLTTGDDNTAIGTYAGRVNDSDNGGWSKEDTNCTWLGARAGRELEGNGGLPKTTPMDNSTAVGRLAACPKSNNIRLGNSAVEEVQTYGDYEVLNSGGTRGIILEDATLGTRHRITLDNGALVVGPAL